MVTINLKSRFRNKAFIVAFVSAIVLLLQQIGLKQYIPGNWQDVLNTVLTILMLLGAVVDTSTPGISDQVVTNETVEDTNTKEEVKTEDSSAVINSEVSEDSQEASIEETTVTNTTVNSNIPR